MNKEFKEIQEIENIIEDIKESKKYILVEGKNDKIALQRLGLLKIIVIDKRPLYKAVEDIVSKTREIIILTDMDKEGKKLYSKISSDVQQFGVKVDNKYREALYKKTKLRQIEGFTSYMKRLAKNIDHY